MKQTIVFCSHCKGMFLKERNIKIICKTIFVQDFKLALFPQTLCVPPVV